jgi:hypothetical protein
MTILSTAARRCELSSRPDRFSILCRKFDKLIDFLEMRTNQSFSPIAVFLFKAGEIVKKEKFCRFIGGEGRWNMTREGAMEKKVFFEDLSENRKNRRRISSSQ